MQTTTDISKACSTSNLWADTHSALCAGRWTDARVRLEVLASRHDNRDQLADLATYERLSGLRPLPDAYRPVIEARIAAVNRVANR